MKSQTSLAARNCRLQEWSKMVHSTRQQFRWLTEGLSIDQPKAIHAVDKRKDFWFL